MPRLSGGKVHCLTFSFFKISFSWCLISVGHEKFFTQAVQGIGVYYKAIGFSRASFGHCSEDNAPDGLMYIRGIVIERAMQIIPSLTVEAGGRPFCSQNIPEKVSPQWTMTTSVITLNQSILIFELQHKKRTKVVPLPPPRGAISPKFRSLRARAHGMHEQNICTF